MKRFLTTLICACGIGTNLQAAESVSATAGAQYKPKTDAHGINWDYTLYGAYQGAGLRASYAFGPSWAWRVGGRTLYTLSTEAGKATTYIFSLMPSSEILVRWPVMINDFWRPYVASELHLHYHISDNKYAAAVAGKSGIEFFLSQNFSVSIEAGIVLPFYRNENAPLVNSGMLAIAGGYYF
ncbi:MAG: hypothetical protein U1F16_03290 [Turneriella sp.]